MYTILFSTSQHVESQLHITLVFTKISKQSFMTKLFTHSTLSIVAQGILQRIMHIHFFYLIQVVILDSVSGLKKREEKLHTVQKHRVIIHNHIFTNKVKVKFAEVRGITKIIYVLPDISHESIHEMRIVNRQL